MGLFRKAKKMTVQAARTVFDSSTVREAEKMRQHHRPRDIEAIAAMDRALGVVHECASKNADVLSQQTIRLMRRVDAADGAERRAYFAKSAPRGMRGYMSSGRAGVKAATFAESGGDVEEVIDHPVLNLLANPNRDFPGSMLAWLEFYMAEITGKSYQMVGFGDNGVPSVLFPMPSQFVQLVYGADGGIEAFDYGRNETGMATIPAEDVLFYRHRVSRFNPLDGEGPLAGVFAEADQLVKNTMHDLALINRGNRPDSILNVADSMATEEQLNELEREINAKHGGFNNANKTFVTRGNVSWTPITWPEKELQSLLKVEHSEKRIRRAFGLPESMADSNASTYAAAIVSENQYAEHTLLPRLNNHAAHLNANLLPLFGMDPTVYCLVYDDPVKADVEALATRSSTLTQGGILTINEARADMGYDPSDEEGANQLRVNGQSLESLDAAPSQIGGGFEMPGMFRGPSDGGSAVKTKTHAQAASAFIFKGMIDSELPEWRNCGCSPSTKDDDDIANEPMIEAIFRDHLDHVQESFEDIVADMQNEVVGAVRDSRPSDLEPLRDQAARVLVDEMKDIVDQGVRFTLDAANQDIESMFDVAQTSALEFLERHAITVADDIASTTETMIRPAIQRGIEQGLSIDDIAKEMDDLPAWRAERIARTEVQTAAQGARYETFKEVGVELVQWVNAPGATTAHQMIAKKVYYSGGKPGVQKIGTPFIKAGETVGKESFTRDVYAPPARPNCRCSIRGIFDTSGGDE